MKLNCWAAISYEGATSFEIFTDNQKGSVYERISNDHNQEIEELFLNGFYCIHDNHPIHKSNHKWMDDSNLKRIKFPNSSDFHLIENLWYTFKDCGARDAPRTEANLRRSLEMNWEIIATPENFQSYFESFHTRHFECLEEGGERLPSSKLLL